MSAGTTEHAGGDPDPKQLIHELESERSARVRAEETAAQAERELQDRRREFDLLEAVSAAASSAAAIEPALAATLGLVCGHLGWPIGHVWLWDRASRELTLSPVRHVADPRRYAAFEAASAALTYHSGEGLPGWAHAAAVPAVLPDTPSEATFPRAAIGAVVGLRASVAIPVIVSGEVVAVVECFSESTEVPTPELLRVLVHVGEQLSHVFERAETEQRLRHRATHDALTGLANRTLFHDRLEYALAVARRAGTTMSVAMLDLDGFKQINDECGHHHGDRMLVEVAARLARAVRESDTLGRVGGDEFAAVLPSAQDPRAALAAARRMDEALRPPVVVQGTSLQPRASIGVALFPGHATDAAGVRRCADAAMYRAKRDGRSPRLFRPDVG
jgi:diguanylate cyclase (GGDEF)-like protein